MPCCGFDQGNGKVTNKNEITFITVTGKGTFLQATSFFKSLCACVCVCEHVCMCHSAHVKGREQLWEPVLSPLGAGPLSTGSSRN